VLRITPPRPSSAVPIAMTTRGEVTPAAAASAATIATTTLVCIPMAHRAGTRVDGPWNIALNSSLNVARGCAEVDLASHRDHVALADAEGDDVGLVAQEFLASSQPLWRIGPCVG
jgi:hypothetical protein